MEYRIIVRTPFGRFSGTMDLNIADGQVAGTLAFMGFTSSFSGQGTENSFSFSGSFDIPIGALDYKADAEVKGDGVHGKAETRLGILVFSPER